MNKYVLSATLGLVSVMSFAGGAIAQTAVENIGDFNYWFAQRFNKDGESVCYAYSVPDKEISSFLVVTNSPENDKNGIVNLEAKSGLMQDSEVIVTIDGKKVFKLRPVDSKAWSVKDDVAIVSAFKKGNKATITYVTAKGDEVTEVYSLSGFTKATAAIDKACPR